MKNKLPPFIAGMLATTLIGGLGVTALAATGQLTITVDPINIQVNGATFQPKDSQGADVPVFAYNGTTYAPLRALAEAYGLEVGYDQSSNMATVKDPSATTTPTTAPDTTASAADYSDWSAEEEAAYQEFKGLWRVGRIADDKSFVGLDCYKLIATEDSISEAERNGEAAVDKFLSSNTLALIKKCCIRLDSEMYEQYETPEIRYAFSLRGSWGWSDRLSSAGWECGYTEF